MIRKIEIERFSLTSSKPFDQVVQAVHAGIGHPDMAEFGRSTHEARSFAELKSAIEKGLSKAGLMLFMQLDQGAVLQKETGQDTPRIIRLLIGNPLIMKEMAKHVPDSGSYSRCSHLPRSPRKSATSRSWKPTSSPKTGSPIPAITARTAIRGWRRSPRPMSPNSRPSGSIRPLRSVSWRPPL